MDVDGVLGVATRLGSLLAAPDADMVVITGSVARGLSDRSSDIDLYVYRAGADAMRSTADALRPAGASLVFGVPTSTGRFEKFRIGGRHVDVEQVSTAVLRSIVERIHAGAVSPSDIKIAAGLHDGVAVIGVAELNAWNARLVLTDAVARAEVARLGPMILSTRAVHDLTWARSDELSYAARVSRILLAGVGLLAAANRRWIAIDDPKWLPWQLGQLPLRPHDAISRVRAVITNPTPASTDDADSLLLEVLDVVDAHVDGADTRGARFALRLRP